MGHTLVLAAGSTPGATAIPAEWNNLIQSKNWKELASLILVACGVWNRDESGRLGSIGRSHRSFIMSKVELLVGEAADSVVPIIGNMTVKVEKFVNDLAGAFKSFFEKQAAQTA